VPTCRRATRLISDGMDRPLSWWERLKLALHLLSCPPCAHFRRAARWLQHGLTPAYREVRLPPDAYARIRRALERAVRDS
jgi:hypothetical protein